LQVTAKSCRSADQSPTIARSSNSYICAKAGAFALARRWTSLSSTIRRIPAAVITVTLRTGCALRQMIPRAGTTTKSPSVLRGAVRPFRYCSWVKRPYSVEPGARLGQTAATSAWLAEARATNAARMALVSPFHLVEDNRRRLEAELIGRALDCDLNRMRLGQPLAGNRVGNYIVDFDAMLVFHQSRGDLNRLAEAQRAHIFDMQTDDRPHIVTVRHLLVTKTKLLEERRTRLFEVAGIVAMPDDA